MVKRYDDGGDIEEETARSSRMPNPKPMKPKGKIVYVKKGGKVSSASKRADGIAQRGKTKGRVI